MTVSEFTQVEAKMYARILAVIDTGHGSLMDRTEQFGKMTGGEIHLLHVGRGHLIPGDVMAGAGLGVPAAEDDVDESEREIVREAITRLRNAGLSAHGEVVNATANDVADVIEQRAKDLAVDIIILGDEHHRGRADTFQSSVAAKLMARHPPCSVLLARPMDR